MCDRDIATNFGVIARKVILVDSCAVIIICYVIVIYFFEQKTMLLADFLVELGLSLFFPEGK